MEQEHSENKAELKERARSALRTLREFDARVRDEKVDKSLRECDRAFATLEFAIILMSIPNVNDFLENGVCLVEQGLGKRLETFTAVIDLFDPYARRRGTYAFDDSAGILPNKRITHYEDEFPTEEPACLRRALSEAWDKGDRRWIKNLAAL